MAQTHQMDSVQSWRGNRGPRMAAALHSLNVGYNLGQLATSCIGKTVQRFAARLPPSD